MSRSIATLTWIAPSTTNTGGKTSVNRSTRTAEAGASHPRKLRPHTNAEITGSNGKEDKGTAMVGAARLSQLCPLEAKPETQINMLIRGVMVGAALLSQLRPTKALLHKQTRRTGRTMRMTIPWDCQIATQQCLKRYSLKKSKNKNTKGSKCTFRNTKSKRPRRGQSKSRPIAMQSGKDKKHTQPYKGAITMNHNTWTSLIVTYARPDTCPREECGQSRQCKDAILRRQEEAAQLKTIDIRATVYEVGGIRKGGESQTSHRRSLPSSKEGGGREKKRHRLYKRVKWMTEPKNKREGIDRHLWSIHLRHKCLECPIKQSTKTSCSHKYNLAKSRKNVANRRLAWQISGKSDQKRPKTWAKETILQGGSGSTCPACGKQCLG
jgi:hypothetical protein